MSSGSTNPSTTAVDLPLTAPGPRPRGPWGHRVLIWVFTIVMAMLVYWLAGFALDDIGTWPGPDYSTLETARLDRTALDEAKSLQQQTIVIERRIAEETARQQSLRDSTDSSLRTMNQLLEFQRLNLQKDVKPSPEEQKALADAERRFLANQEQYQQRIEALLDLDAQRRDLQSKQELIQRQLVELRRPIEEEYQRLVERHEMKIGFAKLAFLLPLMLVAGALFFRLRGSTYAPMVYAVGTAVVVHVALVMHEYFPTRYFKYVIVLTALAVVMRILVYLLRMIVRPKREWLIGQFREAYEAFLCPVCSYPIRRGPLRYLFWTRRSLKKLTLPSAVDGPEEPYVCPACSTSLYEKCSRCGAIRPSLLPSCQHCGEIKTFATTT